MKSPQSVQDDRTTLLDEPLVVPLGDGDPFKVVALHQTGYTDGNRALLYVFDDGETSPASVNLPASACMLGDDQYFMKSWSEGKPFYEALLAAGLIVPTGLLVESGFVSVPAVTLRLDDKS